METSALLEFSDALAQDLLAMAKNRGLTAKELLLALAISEKLLQIVLLDNAEAIDVTLEAEATFAAQVKQLEPN